MEAARNRSVPHGQNHFHESTHARGPLQVPAIGLHGPQQQGCGASGEDSAKSRGFDRVAHRSAGSVSLHIADLRRLHAGAPQRRPNHFLLRGSARDCQAAGPSIVIHRASAQHGGDRISRGNRIRQALQHHHSAAFTAHIAVGAGVEGFAVPVRRKHPRFTQADEGLRRKVQIHSRGQRDVAFAAAQAHHREVHGDERGRARGVYRERRAAHSQKIRQPAGSRRVRAAGPVVASAHIAPSGACRSP